MTGNVLAGARNFTFNWQGGTSVEKGDVVSFGNSTMKRQLKNVAAGELTVNSTDGVNGSQLFSVAKEVAIGWKASASKADNSSGVLMAKQVAPIASDVDKSHTDSNTLGFSGNIRPQDNVEFQVGNNLMLAQEDISVRNATNDRNVRTAKFSYSLNPTLTNLVSATFVGQNKPTVTLSSSEGLTITPSTSNGGAPVKLNISGLDNGNNYIVNVRSYLPETFSKKGQNNQITREEYAYANYSDSVKQYAATLGDVLNSGWNIKNNGTAVDFVRPYDVVNFASGEGTTAKVTSDGSSTNVQYDVSVGNGLKIDSTSKSIVADTGDVEEITSTANGELKGKIKSVNGNDNKLASISTVVKAVNSAKWYALANNSQESVSEADETNDTTGNGEEIKAGSELTLTAGRNLRVKRTNTGFTFSTVEKPTFEGISLAMKNVTNGNQFTFTPTADGDLKIGKGTDGNTSAKITNVADGTSDNDAVNLKQLNELKNKKITLTTSNSIDNNDTDGGEASQILSNGLNFKFKSTDGELLNVSAKTDTVTFTPKKVSLQVNDGKASIQNGSGMTKGLVEASNLVESLNKLGWKASIGKDGTGEAETSTPTLVQSGETVTFKAGDNLKIKQEGTNLTYSLNSELKNLTSVEFNDSANTNGATTKIDKKDGLTITPAAPANGGSVSESDKIVVSKDGIRAGNKAITNVTSGLQTYANSGNTNGNDAKNDLINLEMPNSATANQSSVDNNTAATVGDLRGLGWVLSADKTTGDSTKAYSAPVQNANEVKFKSGNGINVSGKTLDNGTREITFTLAKGEVVKSNEFTAPDGKKLVKVDDKYYSKDDIDQTTGQPKVNKGSTVEPKYKTESGKIVSTSGQEVILTNKGDAYVTGNQVADAVAASGFELGLADKAEADKAFADKTKALSTTTLEKVNDKDKVRFADGKNTKVQAATLESTDANGGKVTTTFVKTDVDLPLTQIYSTDANGNKIVKKDDGKWYRLKADGTTETQPVNLDKGEKYRVSLDPDKQSGDKGIVVDNVADGDVSKTSKEAVNGSQLYAVAKGVSNFTGQIKDLTGQMKDLTGRVNRLDGRVSKLEKHAYAGMASALAASQLPQASIPGKSMVSVAASSYQGENGVALGVSRISDNSKVIIRLAGTANSGGQTGVAAGIGYHW